MIVLPMHFRSGKEAAQRNALGNLATFRRLVRGKDKKYAESQL